MKRTWTRILPIAIGVALPALALTSSPSYAMENDEEASLCERIISCEGGPTNCGDVHLDEHVVLECFQGAI